VPYDGDLATDFPDENGVPHPFTYHCADGRLTNFNFCEQMGCPTRWPEKTFVEWELTDLNGDGYPDFVFNSEPATFHWSLAAAPGLFWGPPTGPGRMTIGIGLAQFGLRSTNQVRASFNVVGVRFDTGFDGFSQSVELMDSEFGVSEWSCDAAANHPRPINPASPCDHESYQRQLAGFADVNGDGLATASKTTGHISALTISQSSPSLPSTSYCQVRWRRSTIRTKTSAPPVAVRSQRSSRRRACEISPATASRTTTTTAACGSAPARDSANPSTSW
jgi:hypothetical protein